MKKTRLYLLMIIASIAIVSCSIEPTNYPYEYVNSKTESKGYNYNIMYLYAYSGELNVDTLKMFIMDHMTDKMSDHDWSHMVIFDSKENAQFPTSPFTAMYGNEEEKEKHVRAYYTFNKNNGFSELTVYELNKTESVAQSYKVP